MQRATSLFERLSGPPKMRVILPEEALTCFRGTEVYEDQIVHLIRKNRLEEVQILIVPSATVHASRGRSYRVMAFADKKDPEVVYQENIFGAHYEADKEKVAQCRRLFSATLPVALGLEEWRESHADK